MLYQILSEHVRAFQKWSSLKAYVILNALEIVFWGAVVFMMIQANIKFCEGLSCTLSWIVVVLGIIMSTLASYMTIVTWLDFRHFREYGTHRGRHYQAKHLEVQSSESITMDTAPMTGRHPGDQGQERLDIPKPVQSDYAIYQQYKADTDSVATWLATTARANGYAEEANNAASSSKNPGASSTRLKGKARKAAKAAQATPQSQTGDAAPKAKYVLRIKDFEPMASFIAKLESISVPEDCAVALERVIWVRKSFSDRLADSGIRTSRAQENSHSFLVSVLEKVRDCLKPIMKAATFKGPESKDASKQSESPANNIFTVLEVYTPSEEFLNAPAAAPPQPTTNVEYTAEQDDSWEDTIFALVSLLSDFGRLRDEVRLLWKCHSAGSLDLAAVAIATNMAFELARSMEDDVKPLFDKAGGVPELVTQYFSQACEVSGIDAEDKQDGDPYNLRAYHLAKSCWANGISMLQSYATGNSGDIIISKYNGKFGWYDEALGDSGATNRARWNQDFTAFNEVITDLQFLSSNMGQGARIEDELIRGVGALMNGAKRGNPVTPLWLAFALQTYIEVLQSFGENCGASYDQMQQECRRIKKIMLDVPASADERSAALKSVTKWDRDPIWTCREQMIVLGSMAPPNRPAFQFLHRNPIHCGLLIHDIRTNFHVSGLRYAATSGGLMCTTQLYHALHQEKLLPAEVVWEDLDEFWKMQGNSAFFVGDPPTDREGYFRNYCLSIGVSASNWAPNRRRGRPSVNTANRRNLKFNGWVSLTMKSRLVPAGERPPLSADMVEGILREGRRHEVMDGKGHIRPELKERAKGDEIDLINSTPASLIEKLASEIDAEIPKLTFDHFTLHNTAWALLTELKDDFTRIFGVDFLRYIPRESVLPFVVGYVFSTAAGRKDVQESAEPVDTMIDAAGEYVGRFLAEGRGRVVKDGSGAVVSPEEVADLDSYGADPWRMDKLLSEIQKQIGRGLPSGGRECPMQ
ncbi:hypothetical protein ACHAPT_000614 [Fusarium lateritium]